MNLRRGSIPLSMLLCALGLARGSLASELADEPAVLDSEAASAPLFADMGGVHYAITTSSSLAQRYFDQGLAFKFGFDVEMAERSFERAAALDPSSAMCAYGKALALGPDINVPRSVERDEAAYAALEEALEKAEQGSELEQALINALAQRYTNPAPTTEEARRALDKAYADAMRDVARRFPDDTLVQTLYAESLMDLAPWKLWTKAGEANEVTPEVLRVLTHVLMLDRDHVGANHLYIHAVEASPHPEWGIGAADRLRIRVPSVGHLLHMPSHIDIHLGRYYDAVRENTRAVLSDQTYMAKVDPGPIFYMYSAHNKRMLSFAAMMAGMHRHALSAARSLAKHTPLSMLPKNADSGLQLEFPMIVHVRFGQWGAVLNEPAPPSGFPYAKGIHHFARGLAFASLGQLEAAATEETELASIHASMPAEEDDEMESAPKVRLGIALTMVKGAIAEVQGNKDEAIRLYRMGAKAEDQLRYMEPPEWYPPVRHWLGAALLSSGRAAEAEEVYEADLRVNRDNGWALFGLAQSLVAQGKDKAAARAKMRYAQAFEHADFAPRSSRY